MSANGPWDECSVCGYEVQWGQSTNPTWPNGNANQKVGQWCAVCSLHNPKKWHWRPQCPAFGPDNKVLVKMPRVPQPPPANNVKPMEAVGQPTYLDSFSNSNKNILAAIDENSGILTGIANAITDHGRKLDELKDYVLRLNAQVNTVRKLALLGYEQKEKGPAADDPEDYPMA